MPRGPFILLSIVAVAMMVSIWLSPTRGRVIAPAIDDHMSVTFEMRRPDFVGTDKTTALTAASFLAIRWPITKSIRLVGEMPFAFFKSSENGEEPSSGATLGNPYISVETTERNLVSNIEIGLRLPIIKRRVEHDCFFCPPSQHENDGEAKTRRVGTYADLSRMEAFAANRLSILLHFIEGSQPRSKIGIRAYGGPLLFISTEGDYWREQSELLLSYGASAWVKDQQATIGFKFAGRTIINSEQLPFSADRSAYQFQIGAEWCQGRFQPGFSVQFPFNDDTGNTLEYVFAAHLTVNFE